MVINHKIPLSVILRGDHIYVRGGFFKKMQRQGIIVAGVDFSRREQWLVIRPRQKKYNEDFELCLVTLSEFLYPQLKLRRVLYEQGDVLLHHWRLPGTSYVELCVHSDVIVNNARILYAASQSLFTNRERLNELIGSKYENFSYICSTTDSRNWTIPFELSYLNHQSSSNIMSLAPRESSLPPQETIQNIMRDDNNDITD